MKIDVKILTIEDDVVIRQFLQGALTRHNYSVIQASSGEEGLSLVAQCMPDLILLDLGLPDMSGLEIITQLREWMQTPIIIISAQEQENTKIEALDAGADDYLTKPISINELLARIRAALRRVRPGPDLEAPIVVADNFILDLARRQLRVRDREVRLTPTEYKLLSYLARNAGRVVRHRELLEAVWGEGYGRETNYLRIYIKHLRGKIESNPSDPNLILNEPGIGYRFVG